MKLVQVSYLHLGSFGKHRTTSGRGGSQTSCSVGAGTCSLPADLINDPMIEYQFIHVQLTITECS